MLGESALCVGRPGPRQAGVFPPEEIAWIFQCCYARATLTPLTALGGSSDDERRQALRLLSPSILRRFDSRGQCEIRAFVGRAVFAAGTRFWTRLLAAQTAIAAQMVGPVLRLRRQPFGIRESPLWAVRHKRPVIYLYSDASLLGVGIGNDPLEASLDSGSDQSSTASFCGVDKWEDDDWEL